ncbi:type II toxin-antitoxin system Phd/YefM family antitoxin [Sphingomonadaceae bacterium OTU29LAMAA1]|nr:type II toxin-antitoxin system Phd/YefM family antitoxin [Sphingomonadaceae bacterium OTU29LAMAA1]
MRTISYAEASANLDALMDEVATDYAPIRIMGEGGNNAILVSADVWKRISGDIIPLDRSPAA